LLSYVALRITMFHPLWAKLSNKSFKFHMNWTLSAWIDFHLGSRTISVILTILGSGINGTAVMGKMFPFTNDLYFIKGILSE
jgi:hypothetical protein